MHDTEVQIRCDNDGERTTYRACVPASSAEWRSLMDKEYAWRANEREPGLFVMPKEELERLNVRIFGERVIDGDSRIFDRHFLGIFGEGDI